MYGNRGGNRGGRERKSGKRSKRSQAAAAHFEDDDDDDDEFQFLRPASRGGGRKRDKAKNRGGKNRRRRDDDEHDDTVDRGGGPRDLRRGQPAQSLSEDLFVTWETLLASREDLRRRLDAIAAVHGWEGRADGRSGGGGGQFLGGVEPGPLLRAIREEVEALGPAAAELGRADLALELRAQRARAEALAEERDRLAEDAARSREECFEAQEELAGQSEELDELRRRAVERDIAEGREGDKGALSVRPSPSSGPSRHLLSAASPATFEATLSRGQMSEGRQVVEALERLKLPDEASMGPHELASWRENKRTITNSLKTISGQIYSAATRILYEIVQNADDCSFEEDVDSAAHRELYIECSDEALVAFHNEKGFQPRDLYAMCQVGVSSKVPGSGKIGRKGIGFKSVFQVCDRPLVISPPFQFCFDTMKHDIFGYIVPSWVDQSELERRVPLRHRDLLCRIFPQGIGEAEALAVSETGTLLVCPMAPRIRLDLMRDHDFDGLSLAFLKNLEKITFVSSTVHLPKQHGSLEAPGEACADSNEEGALVGASTVHEYRVERTPVFDRGGPDQEAVGVTVLKGITVVGHQLFQCTIVERVSSDSGRATETRRHYRLHNYTVLKYKGGNKSHTTSVGAKPATTTISLAFPVDKDLSPLRSTDGELVFAYLPVTAAGFGFAIHADFELVASRQEVSENHGGNRVLLGRVPPLFVHSVLADPALGEDAFPTYLPDAEAVRGESRSGGGRKWRALATALHRETGAWMTIPTEDEPERARRRHVVLRPRHLSRALVPNGLLRAVSAGDKNFAHPDAVESMCLENCLDVCPVELVLGCIRVVLERFTKGASSGGGDDDGGGEDENKTVRSGPKRRSKKKVKDASIAPPAATSPSISNEVLLDVWRYLAAEYKSLVSQGEQGKNSLRLIIDALIGGVSSPRSPPPMRIFPVQGSTTLRLHCEHGVPLCLGLSPLLTEQGGSVTRLAEQVVARLDMDRLGIVEGIDDLIRFLRLGDATPVELEQQLKNCFRFGLATTADPQLWWDSFRYAVSQGHAHGLVDFMPGVAIALPLTDSRVVSSRDVQRLSVSLPCLLGLPQRRAAGSKHVLAIPPSASLTWSACVRWELAMVQAFGITYPRTEIERVPVHALATDLLYVVAEARDHGDLCTLEALVDLLDIYESRMGTLLPNLRAAAEASRCPEECCIEMRAQFQPFPSSCSPKYIDELLKFTDITLGDHSFHDTRDLLGECLGVLQLRPVKSPYTPHHSKSSLQMQQGEDDRGGEVAVNAEFVYGNQEDGNAEEPEEEGRIDGASVVDDDEENDELSEDGDVCDEATWDVMARLLGYRHSFDPGHCAWLLYSALAPALLNGHSSFGDDLSAAEHGNGNFTSADSDLDKSDTSGQPVPKAIVFRVKPFLANLACAALVGCGSDSAELVWPYICNAGGIWLGSDFVSLERCVWKTEGGDIWGALQQTLCRAGPIIAIEPVLRGLLEGQERGSSDIITAMGNCCVKGLKHASNTPPLPHPSDLEMILESVLPWLLEQDGVGENRPHQGWSDETILCYSAVLASARTGFPSGRRWTVPVPSASLNLLHVLVDRGLHRRRAADFVTLPDTVHWPVATDFCLRHFGADCLHPAVAPLFAPLAERQSVGLESPRARIQRTFSSCLRLAASDVDGGFVDAAGSKRDISGNRDEGGVGSGLNIVWSLVSELYERPLSSPSSAFTNSTIPVGFSSSDNWQLLLWAAITCATQWHRMQETGSLQDASRYQETLSCVRRLVPFVETRAEGEERWFFLSERHLAVEDAAAEDIDAAVAPATTAPVMILRTLFGFDLWGNLEGLELFNRAPSYTADIPTGILFACTTRSQVPGPSPRQESFPEAFERTSLVLIWEWFLLEVAGAAPPSVLWATAQEPIAAWVRPRIRAAEASLRETLESQHGEDGALASGVGAQSLVAALLESVSAKTQIDLLFDQMDAADEARREAAAREAELRRQEREAAQARRRLEAEARRRDQQQHERERRQRRERERQQQREQMQAELERQEQMRMQRSVAAEAAATATADVELDLRTLGMQLDLRSLVPNIFGRRFTAVAAAGGTPVRRHVDATMMRESVVKGKLVRFLAGMRAYQRQQAAPVAHGSGGVGGTGSSGAQRLPPVLSDFVVWAGDFLAGQGSSGRSNEHSSNFAEEVARSYLGCSRGSGGDGLATMATVPAEEGEDDCCICFMGLRDEAVYDEVGEPIETACGHNFHAVCFARHMEASEQDPWCPLCRSDDLSARF